MDFRKAIKESDWSGEVKTKYSPEDGLFSKSGEEIASALLKDAKNSGQAMSRLNFYINRAGDKVKNKGELEKAKSIISKKSEKDTSESEVTNIEAMELLRLLGRHSGVPDDDFDQEQLWKGTLVEFEHVPDEVMNKDYSLAVSIAKNIAKDHLFESGEYYVELEKMEDGLSESVSLSSPSRQSYSSLDAMFEFFKKASAAQKIEMKKIMEKGDFEDYIQLVKKVLTK